MEQERSAQNETGQEGRQRLVHALDVHNISQRMRTLLKDTQELNYRQGNHFCNIAIAPVQLINDVRG